MREQRSIRKGLGAELEVCTGDSISEKDDITVRKLKALTKETKKNRECCLFERVETLTWT